MTGSDSSRTVVPIVILREKFEPASNEKLTARESQSPGHRLAGRAVEELKMSILIVTGIEGARNCAAVVAAQLGMEVEVADGRKAALAALRRREFAAVVVDETMAECDPAAAEAIWEHAGLAIPLQINFALSGPPA